MASEICSAAQLSANEPSGRSGTVALEEFRFRQRRVGEHQPERHEPDQRQREQGCMQSDLGGGG